MVTLPKVTRARDLFDALERERPEPVRGLPGSLTCLNVADDARTVTTERWFELHGHREGPQRLVVARPSGGHYVIELLDSPRPSEASWIARIEGAADGSISFGEPRILRRARERVEQATGTRVSPLVFLGGLAVAAYLVLR